LMTPDPAAPSNRNFQTTSTTAALAGPRQKVTLSQLTWNLSSTPPGQVNVNACLRPGMKLAFEPANAQKAETVTILEVDFNLNQITAKFTKSHVPGVTVAPVLSPPAIPTTSGSIPNSVFGNPGPQEGFFDPRYNTL